MRMVLALWPWIREENIDRIDSMQRQQIMKRIQGLKPQHIRVGKPQTTAFRIKATYTFWYTLYTQEMSCRILDGASCQESPLPAANLDFKRDTRRKRKRLARICDSNYHDI